LSAAPAIMPEPRRRYSFVRPPELDGERCHYPVVIVGAGPVGLTLARDLALQGVRCLLLDEDDKVSIGSRAICWSKRTLEIFDRLGCAAPMMRKGVVWNTGRVFVGDDREPAFSFDLLPDKDQCFPAFINLQQYYAEEFLIEKVAATPLAELRWQSRVSSVKDHGKHVEVGVETPQGPYPVTCDHLVAADGSRSTVRNLLGLRYDGEVFEDQFLIVDIRMEAQFPAERWFWFDPPFARGQSALLHRQPDNVWRIDFQLGPHVDRDTELQEERIRERVRRMLGPEKRFEIEWASIYTFQCSRLDEMVHGRILFAGDAAHLVSPFGARGANGGVQDSDNLGWKLALVAKGIAPETLLESYHAERIEAAVENIVNSTRSTDFITPKSEMSRALRDATLELARDHPFARALVNSGRLSMPATMHDSPLNTPDSDCFSGELVPGSSAVDAPLEIGGKSAWFLRQLGKGFTLVSFSSPEDLVEIESPVPLRVLHVAEKARAGEGPNVLVDVRGKLARDLDATPGSAYLFRPDQQLAARWRRASPEQITAAIMRCIGKPGAKGDSESLATKATVHRRKDQHDEMYASLLGLHDGLDSAQSRAVNARLILLMADRLADPSVVCELIDAARGR
jgi:3-(3-hydroxy-phenyl)propionate hydroxylase